MTRRQKKIGVNTACTCGSGKKFKNCCMAKGTLKLTMTKEAWMVLVLLCLGGFMYILSTAPAGDATAPREGGRRVWSAEHGHWHTVP